jgi:HEAT repeat protein
VQERKNACPNCGKVNESQRAHCTECGEHLKAACIYCYHLEPLDALTCSECGINLQDAWAERERWLTISAKKKEEYKEVLRNGLRESQNAEIRRLLRGLDEPENHAFALYCLVNLGGVAVEDLIHHLRDADPDGRYGAAIALGHIGEKKAFPHLVKLLADPERSVRYWTMGALRKLDSARAIPHIARLLADPDGKIRTRARRILEDIGTPDARAFLNQRPEEA